MFDRVIVSTEDDEIASVAISSGAEVPFRREQQFEDRAPIAAATIHAIGQVAAYFGEEFQTVVQLMSNCPLRDAADIVAAIHAFEREQCEFQISCARFGWLNPWWAFRRENGPRRMVVSGHHRPARPGPARRLLPDRSYWIARTAALLTAGTFYGPGCRFEPMPWLSAVDIDDEDDLIFARAAHIIESKSAPV